MSFDFFDKNAEEPSFKIPALDVSRESLLTELQARSVFDVVVVGGGIHGAAFARLSALSGLRTLLVERDDYAGATSSRSSKLAHGGLRYLEQYDFRQVFEGIKARENWLQTSGHIVHAQPFFVPVAEKSKWLKLKMNLGLPLYDFFVADRKRKHRWISSSQMADQKLASFENVSGGFLYYDGVMNDLRLVHENIMAARQEGAICLNYCSLKSFSQNKDGEVRCGCLDQRTGEEFEIKTGVIVNCAGPWVSHVGRLRPAGWQARIRYSKGIHLLFSFPWNGPALLLPLGPRGRYYFVLPHHAGTLVGTTEAELKEPQKDPLPTREEIDQLLSQLQQDVPSHDFSRENLHYCFAGIRTLVAKEKGSSSTSKISRKHEWHYRDGMLSLIGGKFTTAYWSVEEGMKMLSNLTGARLDASLKDRTTPGAGMYEESLSDFRRQAEADGVSRELVQKLIDRYGALVRHFLTDLPLSTIEGSVLKQEIDYACRVEQVETLEDLMRRRLELEYQQGHGLEILDQIAEALKSHRPALNVESEKASYRERMKLIANLLTT